MVSDVKELSPRASSDKTLESFDAELAALNIRGQWLVKDDGMIDGPRPTGVPYVWQWRDIRPKLAEACEVMPESLTARRNFSFYTPGPNCAGTTQTLVAGLQIVKPGEIAWAHRHSMGALRFAVRGNPGLYTVVDGETLTMETNDLVLTPSWSWHDHHNEGDSDGIWLEVLDVPLVMDGLRQGAYEPYGEEVQIRKASTASYLSRRVGTLRPSWERPCTRNYPLRYPWSDVVAALDDFADCDGNPFDGLSLDYVNPANGGPTLPTMACSVMALRPGFETRKRRRTSSAILHVVEGEGRTLAGGHEIEWAPGDTIAVPNWMWQQHINRSRRDRAVLFCVTDEPLLSSLGLYREEPCNTLRSAAPPPIPAKPVYP